MLIFTCMKTLFLNRHAKSSWASRETSDFDRPLNERGEFDAPVMGKRLAKREESIGLIVSSPANRALSTAKIIAAEIGYDHHDIKEIESIYEASVKDLLRIVNSLPDFCDRVMLFGHNPGFTDFADYLTGSGIMNIPTCGICKIVFNTDHWIEVSAHTGHLAYFDFPKRMVEE